MQARFRLPKALPSWRPGRTDRLTNILQRRRHQKRQRRLKALSVLQAATAEVDVAVIGGGIIGLCVALELLHHTSQPTVALIERQIPCSGATGAGDCGPAFAGALHIQHRHDVLFPFCSASGLQCSIAERLQ